jgi:cation diffusion facilitator family transporter
MQSAAEKDRGVQRIILIEGAANLLVLAIKTWVGVTTGSLAILGDALHSLADVINNVVAWIVIKVSAKPPDREHPYGHRKFEGLAVFILATLLFVLAIELAMRALGREAAPPTMNSATLALMLTVLGINIGLSTWQRYWAMRLQSDILLADANHTIADVLTTVVVIAGWQFSARGYAWLDTACALGVAALVMYLSISLFRRVVPILVDEMAIAPEELKATVMSVPGVREVRRVRSRWIGSACSVDIVVAVVSSLSITESHRIADKIETALEADFGITDITIHIEPQDKGAGASS